MTAPESINAESSTTTAPLLSKMATSVLVARNCARCMAVTAAICGPGCSTFFRWSRKTIDAPRRDGGVEASLEVMSSVDVDAEQVFEACVLEWESRVGLWDQLVGETLVPSGDGFLPEVVGQDGALEGWEVEFASVHRRMLLAASVKFWDEFDDDLTCSGPTSSSPEDRAEESRETLVGGSAASAMATGPEATEQLVQGLGRPQSAWAIRQWCSSVVTAREAIGRGEASVRGAGLIKMAKMAKMVEVWQSPWVV